jgi:hypothetical protein
LLSCNAPPLPGYTQKIYLGKNYPNMEMEREIKRERDREREPERERERERDRDIERTYVER